MKRFLFLILFLLFLPVKTFAFSFQGTVVEVLAGDFLKILSEGHFYIVRLANIDAPQSKQPYSKEAKEFTANLIHQKRVEIKTRGMDKTGRILGEVFFEGKNLNHELVKAGLAWDFQEYPEDPQLPALQSQAKQSKKGIWSDPDPVPPWKFRAKK